MTTKISTDNTSGALTSSGGSIALPTTLPASGATLITDASSQYVSQTASPFMRNRIINGAQLINQRYVDAPVAPSASAYSNDRWLCLTTQSSGSFLAARCQGWSNYFDGYSDYLTIANNAAFNLQDTSFTIEMWIYRKDSFYRQCLATNYQSSVGGWIIDLLSTGVLSVSLTASLTANIVGTTVLAVNTWYHIALSGSYGSIKLFVNGIQEGATYKGTTALNSTSAVTIGTRSTPTYDYTGYISNFRIVKGTALYTSNFTPPTFPLVRINNTSLLTCASETFQDKSANNVTITASGNTVVSSLSPFTNMSPSGFISSLMWSTITPASAATSERSTIVQRVEGTSVCDLAWGTPSAKAVTLSFWVRSPVTGTYCASFANNGGSVSYVAEYSINVADTWEKKTVNVPGPVTGTFLTDTSTGFSLRFDLGSGSSWIGSPNAWVSGDYTRTSNQTDFVGASIAAGVQANNFLITGVQLEVGYVATPFEFRPMQAEMALCQRYYSKYSAFDAGVGLGVGVCQSTTVAECGLYTTVPMRVAPVVTQSGTALYDTASRSVSGISFLSSDTNSVLVSVTSSALTSARAVVWRGDVIGSYVALDSEL